MDFPIKNGDFPWQNVSSPEGNHPKMMVNQQEWWLNQEKTKKNGEFLGVQEKLGDLFKKNTWISYTETKDLSSKNGGIIRKIMDLAHEGGKKRSRLGNRHENREGQHKKRKSCPL